jgi:hypothetical protein
VQVGDGQRLTSLERVAQDDGLEVPDGHHRLHERQEAALGVVAAAP